MPIRTTNTIHHLSISPNAEDNNKAVAIYLAISISHFPNSFFIRFELVSAHKDTHFYNIITNLQHICNNFSAKGLHGSDFILTFAMLNILTYLKAVDDPPNSRAGFFVSLRLVVYAYLDDGAWCIRSPYRVPPLVER